MEFGLAVNRGFYRANNLVADAHRDERLKLRQVVVYADERLTAFLEPE